MHSHHHSHDHSSERIGWAFGLNVTFTIIEFIGGWLTNSTAIMADAVHDLGDSLSIGSAWILNKMSAKGSDKEFTYGYRRLSLFGALLNGVVLVFGSLWVLTQSVPRLIDPVMPLTEGMFGLAILGICVNGYAAFKLSSGKSLNEKVLNWHLLEDVLGWVAVLVVSIVLMIVELPILDPILAICFTCFILFNVIRNLKDTFKIFFQAVPETEYIQKIRRDLNEIREINEVHHEHCWSLDGENHVYTAHVRLTSLLEFDVYNDLKNRISEKLEKYNLACITIEFEYPGEVCRDERGSI